LYLKASSGSKGPEREASVSIEELVNEHMELVADCYLRDESPKSPLSSLSDSNVEEDDVEAPPQKMRKTLGR
jgi:hypothetical protein